MNDDELARIRNQEIVYVFQTFNLLGQASACRKHAPNIADRAQCVIKLLDGEITRDEHLQGPYGTR